ncbi:cytochrome b/b6 domain-containing protein [Rosenbergiella collisarenosi]|uniref:cytochrome b/b6 domain-containing protein n=1 Tax=Rosenbergiella collisarenosi TaxID=1544695 RepID=UPI001BD97D36|nr:cytochrome b561 [Rosenbergiella collisarenosi]
MITHYSFAIRLLHWLTLLALLAAYGSIESRSWIDFTPGQRKVVAITHVYAGMSVLIMMLTRVFLRSKRALNMTQPSGQSRLAQWGHGLLYLLFITLPLLSLTARYFRGREWSWLGFAMPITDTPNLALAKNLMSWHVDLAQLGYWLIAAHTLAALYHHVIKKDNTLRAMRLWGK